jgi:uncharacterized membrane protein
VTTYRLSTADIPQREFPITSLDVARPLQWLRRRWEDLRARPAISLDCGLGLAVIGYALTIIVPWLTYTSWHAYRDTLVPTGSTYRP